MVLGLTFIMQTDSAGAIPAFARKYRMSCTTCHAPMPKLKAYGDEFAGNGFVLEDQNAPRYFVDTGDELLNLIRELPLAIRMEGFGKYQSATGKEIDFTTPYNLKLLSGGSLTRNVAYYFYFFFSERGEVAGIEDAYIMFNNLLDQDLDVYVGQFQVSDPLFKREVRLTYEDYMIYKAKIGESHVNLAYDRGLMFTYGIPEGPDIILEVLQGNGIGAADEDRTYDDDKYKNVAGRVSYDFCPVVRGGGFGYYGKEGTANPNIIRMWGLDGSVAYEPFELNLQYLKRRDDNPYFFDSDQIVPPPIFDVDTKGAMAELIFMPHGERSRWYAAGLYNLVDSDLDQHDYETITGHFGYLLRRNIRLIGEYTYDIENEEDRIVVGFISAY